MVEEAAGRLYSQEAEGDEGWSVQSFLSPFSSSGPQAMGCRCPPSLIYCRNVFTDTPEIYLLHYSNSVKLTAPVIPLTSLEAAVVWCWLEYVSWGSTIGSLVLCFAGVRGIGPFK